MGRQLVISLSLYIYIYIMCVYIYIYIYIFVGTSRGPLSRAPPHLSLDSLIY